MAKQDAYPLSCMWARKSGVGSSCREGWFVFEEAYTRVPSSGSLHTPLTIPGGRESLLYTMDYTQDMTDKQALE